MKDVLLHALSGSRKTVSGTSLADDLLKPFSNSMMQRFTAIGHAVAVKDETEVSKSEVRLTFVEFRYILGAYIRTL